jgi:hypothetical protein
VNNNEGLQSFVQINGNPGTTHIHYARFNKAGDLGLKFAGELAFGGWDLGYFAPNEDISISTFKGSGNPFNGMDIGMLVLHGAYGTSTDMQLGRSFKQMYFPIASGAGARYLRMSDMNLGGASTNSGLKWMALMACTSLYPPNWTSMQNQQVHPYNSNMHMILGMATDFGAEPLVGQLWADYMIGKGVNPTTGKSNDPMKIQDAWYAAAKNAYNILKSTVALPNPTMFAVAGDNNCLGDYLQTKTNTVFAGAWSMPTPVQVYPAP